MHRVIFHLDMDAFYASVERRDNPALKGKPVIVGSPPTQRGVVCAASYEARKFGVKSAMPSMTAGRLCPKGFPATANGGLSRRVSRDHGHRGGIRGELVQQVSVDEAYVDVSATAAATVDASLVLALPLAQKIKAAIRERRQLTATIGVAPNKLLLTKLASDFQKPDGLTLIRDSEKVAFLKPLPVRSLHGVGKVTEENLHRAGIRTVGDLQNHPGDLRALVGSWGPELKRFAFGEDDRPLELGDEVKSISSENTFLRDTDDRPILRACLKEQAEDIARSLSKRRLAARTVQVKVRYGDFTSLTRQISMEEPLTEAREIYRLGCWLLGRDRLVNRPLRLLGLGVSGLVEAQVSQLRLSFGS
ncbi:MAG: DNA polymerase IV [Verrucomicrobiota bacterium]